MPLRCENTAMLLLKKIKFWQICQSEVVLQDYLVTSKQDDANRL